MRVRRPLAGSVAAALVGGLLVSASMLSSAPAEAANAADFDPGNIIADQVFFDSSAMSVEAIQQFLNQRGASCVAGEQPCLKDYVGVTSARAAEAGICSGYVGERQETAAQMIAGVAQSCGINPRVLLVLLEKEQSLVTRTRPTTRAYQAATGFGCPDTAPCDAQYYGLFNQLYQAARQFQRYAAYPNSYGYKAGRTNTIYWHPNVACGTSQVYIENQATAGLYNYTPYRPNAAALANLYGTGDSCSSYGNRNFWRLFTDWFGSTQASGALMRSASNPTVYLVSGDVKYPIGSMSLVEDLAPAGPLAFVSQQYLDRRTTGPSMQHLLHGPDGSVYLVDKGVLYPFGSCGQVTDYGMSCGSLVSVTAEVISAFRIGPVLSSSVRTTNGKIFRIVGGERREAADDDSLIAASLPAPGVTLPETAIDHLPYGVPFARSGVVVRGRTSGDTVVISDGTALRVPAALAALPGMSGGQVLGLDDASLARIDVQATLSPVVRDATTGTTVLLTTSGRVTIDAEAAPANPPQVPSSLTAALPDAGSLASPVFVKEVSSATVYLLRGGELRPIPSWTTLVRLNGGNDPSTIATMPNGSAALLTTGHLQIAPGTMLKSPSNGSVFVTTTLDDKIPLSSFGVTAELGIELLVTLPESAVDAYTTAPDLIRTAVTCGSTSYVGLSGTLYPASADTLARYGLTPTPVSPSFCSLLRVSTQQLDRFIRTPDGSIYVMEGGSKRPIGSMRRYLELGGDAAVTVNVTTTTANRFPTGPLA